MCVVSVEGHIKMQKCFFDYILHCLDSVLEQKNGVLFFIFFPQHIFLRGLIGLGLNPFFRLALLL